ncbi:MAG: family 20 glycosylhydrolase [Tannerella sp.]|jgi:hexosaminidase|nr:family 20 glycosylhydrolase [Tannerella sp.]
MKRIIIIFALSGLLTNAFDIHAKSPVVPSIIPFPAQLEMKEGFFTLSAGTQLTVNDNGLLTGETAYLQQELSAVFGRGLAQTGNGNALLLEISDGNSSSEGYRLDITPERIHLSAAHSGGMFYGIQTLKQLILSYRLSPEEEPPAAIRIPCLSVTDDPAFEWRGCMLDVSRHFFPVEYLKKQVDRLAFYKMNRMHLHLTDDQGWRVEIKKYPELTQKGAWRTFNRQDSFCMAIAKINPDFALDPRFIISGGNETLYGGFYSQDEIKDLVQYASSRHVEIVPEIDMPGHIMAAIKAYPELSCTGEAGWGETFSFPLCPCNEATFVFLENVLDEIISLFPSRYIHIGADEVDKTSWETSEACRNLMKENHPEQVADLQGYFVERIRKYLFSKGKEMIAWDEVMESKVNPGVHVMFWRDWIGDVPEKIAANGNRMIFSPTYPLYLSRRDSSLYPIYKATALLHKIPPGKQSLVMGAQANIWSEGTPSEPCADYLYYPKLLALSEVLWTVPDRQDWESFKQRIDKHFIYLDKEGIRHSQRTYALTPSIRVDTINKRLTVQLESEQTNPEIYYTTDGTVPTMKSLRYPADGIVVRGSAQLCAAVYDKGEIRMPVCKQMADYHKAIGRPVTYTLSWDKAYPANAENTLTDGLRGSERHNDHLWQGFTTDLDVIIDMRQMTTVSSFSATFIQSVGPGILTPEYVEVSLSEDGIRFEKALVIKNDVPETDRQLIFKKFHGVMKKKKARYIKVFAKNRDNRFLFTDELIIN